MPRVQYNLSEATTDAIRNLKPKWRFSDEAIYAIDKLDSIFNQLGNHMNDGFGLDDLKDEIVEKNARLLAYKLSKSFNYNTNSIHYKLFTRREILDNLNQDELDTIEEEEMILPNIGDTFLSEFNIFLLESGESNGKIGPGVIGGLPSCTKFVLLNLDTTIQFMHESIQEDSVFTHSKEFIYNYEWMRDNKEQLYRFLDITREIDINFKKALNND